MTLAVLVVGRATAQEPEGSQEPSQLMIQTGKLVYFGAPSCVTCHGAKGKGTEGGPDLTDETWLHGDGSYEAIVRLVTHGVAKDRSKSGEEMPSRGWAHSASDDEIRAVAAFVWSLSKNR